MAKKQEKNIKLVKDLYGPNRRKAIELMQRRVEIKEAEDRIKEDKEENTLEFIPFLKKLNLDGIKDPEIGTAYLSTRTTRPIDRDLLIQAMKDEGISGAKIDRILNAATLENVSDPFISLRRIPGCKSEKKEEVASSTSEAKVLTR